MIQVDSGPQKMQIGNSLSGLFNEEAPHGVLKQVEYQCVEDSWSLNT